MNLTPIARPESSYGGSAESNDRFNASVNRSFPREGVAVVEFVGEHDLRTKQETGDLLAELVRENELVVVDPCSTTFIDSSILNCLVVADRDAKERDHELRLLISDATSVAAVLNVTGVDELLKPSPTATRSSPMRLLSSGPVRIHVASRSRDLLLP